MTRKQAYELADNFIPDVFGSLRTAWVNGFINYQQRGVAKYQRGTAPYVYRQRGAKDRKRFDNGIKWWSDALNNKALRREV